ncbi:MAG: IS200/IS605 family accessory protein TnpB-related protein [Clostridia bacterium]|nr:IS200/IS605 family accessory protein TnpB-related protein [Clostridia bacterium]
MKIVKITIQAVLFNVSHEYEETLNNMMLIFCTAIRYSFKRLLEGQRKGDLEKDVASKYKLSIRQAKDAVESARQTIQSQKELLKLNYNNYDKKAKRIEKELKNEKLSEKKQNALIKKLEKRKRKSYYYQKLIENNQIPPVTFGTKKMFIRRCKGLITNEEWKNCRNNRLYSRGDKTKKGNPNLRIIIKNKMSYLEISTLQKTETNRAIKIQIPIYLPQKLSKKTGKINGNNYREMFLNILETNEAYQVEIIKRNNKYYVHITFDIKEKIPIYTNEHGVIGIDTNPDGFALTCIDNKGNHKWHKQLKQPELLYARSNRRKNLCGELVKQAIEIAKTNNTGITIENLKFEDDKDVQRKFARIKHQFIYRTLLTMLESACKKEGIEIIKVKPQFTSKIGLYKYCHQYGMDVHNGAAMVIGRRSYRLKEKVPKLLKNKLIDNIEEFNKKNEWSKWSKINNIIKRKVGEKPDSWIKNRKQTLGLAS